MAYWQQHRGEQGARTIAAALGVSLTTLQGWRRSAGRRRRFRPVAVVNGTRAADAGAVTIQITAAGPRVEGLTVESAARLLTLLR